MVFFEVKDLPMLRHQRHQAILEQLEQKESITLEELCALIESSESTIRRDIDYLASDNQVTKIRGGVARKILAAGEPRLVTSPYHSELIKNEQQKASIGHKAAKLLTGQESIIINGGTTTWHLANNLPDSGLTILTNSLPVVGLAAGKVGNRCFVTGGEVFHRHMVILGHLQNGGPNFFGDIFFTGCQGISPWGIMEGDPLLVQSEQEFIAKSEKLVILADSSKFTTRKSIIMSPLDKVDLVITDSAIQDEARQMLNDAGVKLLIADA